MRIGVTFRGHDREICRSFTDAGTSGLACRDGEDWHVRGLFSSEAGPSGEHRMAAGVDPNLAALIGSSMAGEPFDSAQERAALKKNWR